MDVIQRRKQRIAILIALLAIAALAWQLKFRSLPEGPGVSNYVAPPVASSGGGLQLQPLSPGFGIGSQPYTPSKPQGPNPETFAQFSYTGGSAKLSVADVCDDTYYALLIFSAEKDYRNDPSVAVYNTASLCEKDAAISLELDLSSLNLKTGDYYYFIADQGATSSWYNPR